jgi:hypothetical protein
MQDAATFVAETGQQFRDWWRLDLERAEQRMLDLFASVADQTSLQLQEMAEQLRETAIYRSGEVTGPGTLVCSGCGKELLCQAPGPIPPCPQCQGTEFRRQMSDDQESLDDGAEGKAQNAEEAGSGA